MGPIGKVLIKKSVEYKDKSHQRLLNIIGLLFLIIFSPLSNVASYYFAENAIVAPISASGVLVNLIFAKLFLDEGKHMNRYTILGIISFVTGLFLIVFTYSALVGNETTDEVIDWGILSLFFGLWLLLISIGVSTVNFFNTNSAIQLVGWSVLAGLFSGSDIVASMDTWIWTHTSENDSELYKGILAVVFYTFSCSLGVYILNQLLLDPENPMHIVATIISSVTLFADVVADCIVFQRYSLWDSNNYAMAVIGLILMIVGINVLQTSKNEQFKSVHDTSIKQQEETELLDGTMTTSIEMTNTQKAGSLTPPPSLLSCGRIGGRYSSR